MDTVKVVVELNSISYVKIVYSHKWQQQQQLESLSCTWKLEEDKSSCNIGSSGKGTHILCL
jgi:hypothetical protein